MYRSITLAALAAISIAAPSEDVAGNLPNAPAWPSTTYSGYLTVSETKQLHYVFATSLSATASADPVVVWFNGGPGCSSMLGLMQENGPLVIDDGQTTPPIVNEYPWNQQLNMLWIDSPAGVGWSIAGDEAAFQANDLSTSQDALQAMKSFYVKFPEYLPNELFISGESYAGVYVPWLSWQIYTNNQQVGYDPSAVQMNLQGFMVGNGATNWEFDVEPSFAQTLRWFNIIPPSLLDDFESNDCHYYFYPAFNPDVQTPKCDALWLKINEYSSGLNWYDLYRPVYPDSAILAKQAELRANRYGSVTIDGVEKRYKKGMTPQEYMPWAKHLAMADKEPIILGDYLTDYMNLAETRTAFNIPSTVQAWEMCSSDVVYTEQHFASEWIYQTLRYSVRKLFYSGDTDGAVNTYGSKRWIANLNWSTTNAWNPWFTDEQVSGYAEKYDGNFDFVTVKGVGHMAPQWARKAVLQMINNFVLDQPF